MSGSNTKTVRRIANKQHNKIIDSYVTKQQTEIMLASYTLMRGLKFRKRIRLAFGILFGLKFVNKMKLAISLLVQKRK